jgi:Glyoxalase/Bleomycin resistance protein/Dioxygenase superfamily
MGVRLEHANLTVRDINGMVGFLQTAFPEFRVRGEGKNRDESRWVHVRTDETYIALSSAKEEPERQWMPYQGQPGVNHLAYVVDDVEALCGRMRSAGYKDSPPQHTSLPQAPILLRPGRQRLGIRAVPLRKSR